MGVNLIDKIIPKNDGFTGLVDADQVIGGAEGGTIPLDAIVGLTVSQIAATSIVTATETIGSNNVETMLPTSAAVKAYVDSQSHTDTVSSLTDTTITVTPADNEILAYDNGTSEWINQTPAEAELLGLAGGTMTGGIIIPTGSDITLTDLPTVDADAANKAYVDSVAGAGVSDLDDISDITITGTPADNEILAYNLGTTEWINQTAAEASLATLTGTEELSNKTLNAPLVKDSTNLQLGRTSKIKFEGTTDDDADTLFFATDPTTNRTITLPDASGTVSLVAGTETFTNKTFDVEATGNSISNIDIEDFKAAAIVLESEGLSSNDNDTSLPTSAAVIDYVTGETGARDLDDLDDVNVANHNTGDLLIADGDSYDEYTIVGDATIKTLNLGDATLEVYNVRHSSNTNPLFTWDDSAKQWKITAKVTGAPSNTYTAIPVVGMLEFPGAGEVPDDDDDFGSGIGSLAWNKNDENLFIYVTEVSAP